MEKLSRIGVHNVVDVLIMDLDELSQKSKVSYKDLLSIQRVLLAQYSAFPMNGADLYDDVMSSVAIISTGSSNFDQLLDGGLYTAEITEVIGPVASGKTQFCLSIALSVAMETKQNIVYFDTGSSFNIVRLQDMLEARQKDSTQTVEMIGSLIRCCKVYDIFELLSELETLKATLAEQTDKLSSTSLKLVIVDCVAAVISPVLGGSQTDGHAYMMHVSRILKTLAVEYSVAVLITNNVVYGDGGATRPAMGRTWSHVPNTRIELVKPQHSAAELIMELQSRTGGDLHRRAVLLKSDRLLTNVSTSFVISDYGVQ
ncbi:DNA repair protein RAD51-like protein 4 [Lamellibrachia satsuma]|nr:DNA repair protein RAD51-like protein 4 [Lamellibrachia satsuma]